MVLVFMFGSSWRLTVVTFVLVPCVLLISKVRCLWLMMHTLNVLLLAVTADSYFRQGPRPHFTDYISSRHSRAMITPQAQLPG